MAPDHRDVPMPADRFHELLARRERAEAAAPPEARLPDRELPPAASTPFARELLADSDTRVLEAGELLILFEEAALSDLQAAAGTIAEHAAWPVVEPPADVVLPPSLADVLLPGAWLLSDRVRRLIGRTPSAGAWLKAAAATAGGGLPVSADFVIGHLETFPERLEHLGRLREFHERTHGLRAVGLRPCRDPAELGLAPAGLKALVPPPPAFIATDLARTAAIARLGLPREVAVYVIAPLVDPAGPG